MEKISVRIDDAVAMTGIGKTSLYRLVRQGKLKAYKLGNRTLFRVDDLLAVIDGLPPLARRAAFPPSPPPASQNSASK